MGYEIKLVVGKSRHTDDEYDFSETPAIPTGKTKTYFSNYTILDLCKPGYDSSIYGLSQSAEPEEGHFWYFYGIDGGKEVKEDKYGRSLVPFPISLVINALEEDVAKDEYRRFKWALALLKSMEDDEEELEVILFGH